MELVKSAKYRRIAERLLKLPEFEEIREARVAYLASDEAKKKNHKIIYADCAKVSPRYSWCCPYDYMITVYEPNIVTFNKKQLEILIRHELHHIGVDTDHDVLTWYVVPHDVEEFNEIIREHGLYWDNREDD